MIYNIVMAICSIMIPAIIMIRPIKAIMKRESDENIIPKYKYELIAYILIVIGCLLRTIAIDAYPKGLNVDEASSSYDAFSILNFGVDRNGNSFPVFLYAWGSGQNALYSYLIIPFAKLLGLNIISTRLPMAIIGCISLFVWYQLLKDVKNKKFAIIGLAFLVICPWHIMKSRWGLESNLFPDLVLYAVYFMVLYLKRCEKKNIYFFISMCLLGLTAYSYGTSYLFLPFFIIPLLGYLLYKKEITLKKAIAGLLVVGIVSFPIILYVLINTFDLQQINLGIFTIPKLPVNRYEEQTNLFAGNLIINLFNNFCHSIKLLFTQNDGLIWNGLSGYGIYYLVSIPFLLVGFIHSIQQKNEKTKLIHLWFYAAFLLLFFFKDANINRINIIIFPLLYFIINGLYIFISFKFNKKKTIIIPSMLIIIYLLSFLGFSAQYTNLNNNGFTFVEDVEEVIKYVNSLDVENIYFEYSFKEPYIYVLYYNEINPNEFINSVEYFDKTNLGRFDNVKEFGRYHFYIPEGLNIKNSAYVIKKENIKNMDDNNFKLKEFKEYIVLEKVNG